MSERTPHGDDSRGTPGPVDPNIPEIAGTTLPLLSGVLAGFAITAVIALALSAEPGELSTLVTIATTALLLSVVCFINSIAFSIKAQSSNYLPFLDLSDAALRALGVTDHAVWIRALERRWLLFHVVAIGSFYLGAGLFLAGLNLVVWEFVGALVGLVFMVAVVAMVATVVGLDLIDTVWGRRLLRKDGSDG